MECLHDFYMLPLVSFSLFFTHIFSYEQIFLRIGSCVQHRTFHYLCQFRLGGQKYNKVTDAAIQCQ